jgi:hypothetical protein
MIHLSATTVSSAVSTMLERLNTSATSTPCAVSDSATTTKRMNTTCTMMSSLARAILICTTYLTRKKQRVKGTEAMEGTEGDSVVVSGVDVLCGRVDVRLESGGVVMGMWRRLLLLLLLLAAAATAAAAGLASVSADALPT